MGISFRFIQCGDLHLGTPFRYVKSLGRQVDEVANRATYRSFEAIVRLALDERVDAVLITGDIYDSEERNLEAQVRFARECERLAEKRIPVFMVHGNHDPMGGDGVAVPLPDNVHVFSDKAPERVPLMVGGRAAAYVYGISCNKQNVKENLAVKLKPFHDDPFSIGLFHGAIGASPDHDDTAPCTLDDLLKIPMGYWAVGHIHKRQILHENPHIVYAGNPQGLHRKEIGAKGCYLVQVSANGRVQADFRETEALRFEQAIIDIGTVQSSAELEEMIRHKKEMLRKHKKPVLLEIVLSGAGPMSSLCREESVRRLWLESSQAEEAGTFGFVMPYAITDMTTIPVDWQERRKLEDLAGDYLRAYDQVATLDDGARLAAVRAILDDRPETKRLGGYRRLLTDDLLMRALRRAETEGAARLIGDSDED